MRERIEAALAALSRGNLEETREHLLHAHALLPEEAPMIAPVEVKASGIQAA